MLIQTVKNKFSLSRPAALMAAMFLMNQIFPAPVAAASACNSSRCDLIEHYVNPAINILSVLFALVVVISVILGAIQYISSEGDPQKSSKAKNRITNAVLAFFAYALMYGFLQFLIPGGIFR
jgi:hypothetical protein